MATLNQILCATNIKNTGYGSCVIDPKLIRGAIRVENGRVYTQTELDALRATFETDRLAPLKSKRIFPIHGFKTFTDNSEETIYQTFGDGSQVPVRDGNYRWTYQYIDGGLCLAIALRSHNFQASSWLFYDDNGVILGFRKLDATGLAYGLAGIPLLFHANKWKAATAAEAAAYTVYFDIDPKYLNDFLGFVQADFALSEITGLQNIALKQTGASAAGVVKIQAFTGCDVSNLYSLYSTELASTSLWIATNATTGNVISITSVVADPNASAFTITLTSSDSDYPGSSSGLVNITLVNPTLLDAADVSGFESNSVQVLRG